MKAAGQLVAFFNESSVRAEALRILVAAAVIGFLYNQTSPLGVRASQQGGDATPAVAAAGPESAVAVAAPGSPYRLATVSTAWQEDSAAARTVPSTPAATAPTTAGTAPIPAAGARRKPTSITWAQAKQLLPAGNGIVLDARSEEAYNAGHITGALSFPYVKLSEKIKEFTAQYPDKSRMILVYCNNPTCSLSVALGEALINDYGYTNVNDMPGGLVEWQTAMTNP